MGSGSKSESALLQIVKAKCFIVKAEEFKAYRQLQNVNINNKIAVETITYKDYREDKLTTTIWAKIY
ncbi:17864_t:CDS:2 [Cetraspora pellucida]|uniref:17864_t:CDS:1 n=1 Tax=Cetraspora pellucida TaxID=1433469 RepID=A0A9N9E9J3_9GLOM|nr:17864_t:CDS:2 [Cetraspora pellucida]